MELQDILLGGSGGALALMTLLQVAPIEINPWSAIAKAIGRALNGDVMDKLNTMEKASASTRKVLDEHIAADDARNADMHRARILQFNNELLRNIPHTREDFIEVLAEIDFYERYCTAHPEYSNNRAIHAINNIGRVYDERLQKHDFL